jgi:hypothetical protein
MSDPTETPEARTARLLRQQAKACAQIGSPLYETLLLQAADDLLAGGPTRRVLDGHLEDAGPSALALRMLGGVHALVLTGRAPDLARYYPSSATYDASRTGDPADTWPAFRSVLDDHLDDVREWLRRPPQTNEVGRGAALVGGLLHVCAEARLPVRLVEVGASGGLNLRADRFRIDGDAGRYGDAASPVNLGAAWLGIAPPPGILDIVGRDGGDLDPVDVSTDAGRLLLTAYVWPDQVERVRRLRGAFDLADVLPLEIHRESAEQTLERTTLADGTWTVVWHSVFRQYLNTEVQQALTGRIEALASDTTATKRLAHLMLEPMRGIEWGRSSDFEFLVTLQTWPGGERRVLATAAPHGVPTTWER